ncbi:MAG: hypothetical protein ACK5YV_05070, partial [Betaproteobacteria bacterium]
MMLPPPQLGEFGGARVLANGDDLPLRRDDAAPRVVHLGDVAHAVRAAPGAPRQPLEVEAQLGQPGVAQAL